MEARVEMNRGGNNTIGQSGVGYIVIPDDITREQYISNCYRTHTVTINGGYGYGYICQVRIFPDVLQKITFPLTSEERGSQVFWVRENFSNRPVVIGILSEDGLTNLLTENQDRIVQEIDGKIVEIFQDANSATLNINIVGVKDTPAKINIKVASGSEDSVVNIISDGQLNADANQIQVTARKGISLYLKDGKDEEQFSLIGDADKVEFKDKNGNGITINADNVNIVPANTFNLSDGKEPMVLGKTLVNLIKELISAIQQISVPTPHGVSGTPINSETFSIISGKLETMLSKISNLD